MQTDEITLIEQDQPAQPQQRALAPQAATPADLVRYAMDTNADMDRLERLYALQVQWEERQAKKAFDQAFSEFKAEGITIIKNRSVTDGPLKGKKYAELFAVVNAVSPMLSKHGLSSSWKVTQDIRPSADGPGWLEVTCYLKHVDGHVESTSMGGPPDTGGAKNAMQARASTKSYLERYTLKTLLGLAEQGEDDDGAGGAAESLLGEWQAKIDVVTTLDALERVRKDGTEAFNKTKGGVYGFQDFMRAVQARRKELREGGAA